MANHDIPEIQDFPLIAEFLEKERKAIIKVNNFSEDDDDYVRTVTDAKILLTFFEKVQLYLFGFFKEHPSLVNDFNNDFLPLHQFFNREFILETIFLDDCLIPEKEMFFFGQDGSINNKVLELHEKTFRDWTVKKSRLHKTSQTYIKEQLSVDTKSSDLDCHCVGCMADYRTKLREVVYKQCLDEIEVAETILRENISSWGLNKSSELFTNLQRSLDKKFHKVRYRLKRGTVNRLENQVKQKINSIFTYPADLALTQEKILMPFFKGWLTEEELKDDLVSEEEYKRFFNQISSNIWKGENYLLREFKKLVKSVMVLKRKDISGKILQEYLGEFWVHSQARTIKRKIIYHMGPTNSGKTYHAIEALCEAGKGCYLAPLRLLAGELFDTMNQKGVVTNLLTGEEVVEVDGATHYSSTIEMARLQEYFDCCVIDEIQMITDKQRGWAWTRALVNIFAQEIHLCGDPSALDLIKNIVELCGDELEIRNYDRMTRLEVEKRPVVVGELKKNDALIVFSRRNALRFKADLERNGFKVSIVYGRLSPEVRREQARKFDHGETDIMVSTDAIAMGMNLPIRRIVFSTLSKFINSQEFPISESEIKQIAGRAGRFQRFSTGYVTCLEKVEDGIDQVREALDMKLEQQKKCMVGPDLDIFNQVNGALDEHGLPQLRLSEFLRLFNTMIFQKPFFCVELKEMIDIAEMVEEADSKGNLSNSEIFGFSCAPVNLGLMEHVQYFVWILNNYVQSRPIHNEAIDFQSNDIDYLETSIKCVELYQWLSRHFNNKNFDFDENQLLDNKSRAVDTLNTLLSDKIVPTCSSCGCKLPEKSKFAICEDCFKKRRFGRNKGRPSYAKQSGHVEDKDSQERKGDRRSRFKKSDNKRRRPKTRKRRTNSKKNKS